MKLLDSDEIRKYLSDCHGWYLVDNTIEKEFKLKSFADAVAFLVKIGIEAEKIDHHPDLLLHSWNKLKVVLTTHSENGITENDFKLAQTINSIRQ